MPAESYLGFLYALEEVAVYGYVTPLKLKIVLALALSDAVVRDADVISVRLLFFSRRSPLCSLILPIVNRFSRRCTGLIIALRLTRSSNLIRRSTHRHRLIMPW